MHNIDHYRTEMTQNRDSLKMPYIYSVLTWLAEWEDFMAQSSSEIQGGILSGPLKL